MVCPFCGKEIPDDSVTCEFCKNSVAPEQDGTLDEYGVYDEFGQE